MGPHDIMVCRLLLRALCTLMQAAVCGLIAYVFINYSDSTLLFAWIASLIVLGAELSSSPMEMVALNIMQITIILLAIDVINLGLLLAAAIALSTELKYLSAAYRLRAIPQSVYTSIRCATGLLWSGFILLVIGILSELYDIYYIAKYVTPYEINEDTKTVYESMSEEEKLEYLITHPEQGYSVHDRSDLDSGTKSNTNINTTSDFTTFDSQTDTAINTGSSKCVSCFSTYSDKNSTLSKKQTRGENTSSRTPSASTTKTTTTAGSSTSHQTINTNSSGNKVCYCESSMTANKVDDDHSHATISGTASGSCRSIASNGSVITRNTCTCSCSCSTINRNSTASKTSSECAMHPRWSETSNRAGFDYHQLIDIAENYPQGNSNSVVVQPGYSRNGSRSCSSSTARFVPQIGINNGFHSHPNKFSSEIQIPTAASNTATGSYQSYELASGSYTHHENEHRVNAPHYVLHKEESTDMIECERSVEQHFDDSQEYLQDTSSGTVEFPHFINSNASAQTTISHEPLISRDPSIDLGHSRNHHFLQRNSRELDIELPQVPDISFSDPFEEQKQVKFVNEGGEDISQSSQSSPISGKNEGHSTNVTRYHKVYKLDSHNLREKLCEIGNGVLNSIHGSEGTQMETKKVELSAEGCLSLNGRSDLSRNVDDSQANGSSNGRDDNMTVATEQNSTIPDINSDYRNENSTDFTVLKSEVAMDDNCNDHIDQDHTQIDRSDPLVEFKDRETTALPHSSYSKSEIRRSLDDDRMSTRAKLCKIGNGVFNSVREELKHHR